MKGTNMILRRYGSTPDGTFGELHADSFAFYTVEKPWRDNKPNISCVPCGKYRLVWMKTTTKVPAQFDGHTWYLVGDTVGIDDPDKARSRCAIHIGNIEENVEGCIAPGLRRGWMDNGWAVAASTDAMVKLLQVLGPQDHELTIVSTPMGDL